jgi:hypothetical protein
MAKKRRMAKKTMSLSMLRRMTKRGLQVVVGTSAYPKKMKMMAKKLLKKK